VDAGSELDIRPAPDTWSALEYAAHTRDVTALHVFGVEQALTGEEPEFPAIDGGALIDTAGASYHDEDPRGGADGLEREARSPAQVAGDAGPEVWDRGITIGGERSTVRRLLEHALHDATHHLADAERGVQALRAGSE